MCQIVALPFSIKMQALMILLFAHGEHIIHIILMFFNKSLQTISPRKWIASLCNYYTSWHIRILKGGNFSFFTFLVFRPISMQCFANDQLYVLLIGYMHNIICYFISKRAKKVAKFWNFSHLEGISNFCHPILKRFVFFFDEFSLSPRFPR